MLSCLWTAKSKGTLLSTSTDSWPQEDIILVQPLAISDPSPCATSLTGLASQFSSKCQHSASLSWYLELCNHHPIPSQKTYVRDDNPKFLTTRFTWEACSGGLGRSFTAQSILLCLGLFINSTVSSSLTLRRNYRTKFSILLTKGSCWKHCPFCFSVFWNQHTHTNTSFRTKSCVVVVFPS